VTKKSITSTPKHDADERKEEKPVLETKLSLDSMPELLIIGERMNRAIIYPLIMK
jgi:hypothetical protein